MLVYKQKILRILIMNSQFLFEIEFCQITGNGVVNKLPIGSALNFFLFFALN